MAAPSPVHSSSIYSLVFSVLEGHRCRSPILQKKAQILDLSSILGWDEECRHGPRDRPANRVTLRVSCPVCRLGTQARTAHPPAPRSEVWQTGEADRPQ